MIAEIASIIAIVLVTCHYIACAWFLLGTMSGKDRTWVLAAGLDDRTTVLYSYGTSLHWSLSQFTPATIEVRPCNEWERLFANCIVVFGLITFSTILSSITSKMSVLRSKHADRHQQEEILWRYCSENKVSVELARCIVDVHAARRMEKTRRLQQNDVVLLADLPFHLRKQLHLEVYDPIISHHPLFWRYRYADFSTYAKMCNSWMSETNLVANYDVFHKGDKGDSMYFIISGELCYCRRASSSTVKQGDWISEAVLWIKDWQHRGKLVATTKVDVVTMNGRAAEWLIQDACSEASQFVKIYVSHFLRDELDMNLTDPHAVHNLNSTDIWGSHDSIDKICALAAVQTWGRDSWVSRQSPFGWSVASLTTLDFKSIDESTV